MNSVESADQVNWRWRETDPLLYLLSSNKGAFQGFFGTSLSMFS